jgi:hypothetical protein
MMTRLRHTIARASIGMTAAIAAAGFALAQPAPPPMPPPAKLEALPEVGGDVELEPQVTITRKENETIEEARVNGKLMWVKVTPRHGRPYYLLPDSSDFGYGRRDIFDSGLKVPMWVLLEF